MTMTAQMGFVQPTDVLLLLVAIAGFTPIILSYRRNQTTWLFLAYMALLGTVLISFFDQFITQPFEVLLEHGFSTLFSILFFLSAYHSRLKIHSMKEDDAEVFS